MSGAISGSVIGTYLSITKDEAAQVALQEKGDGATQAAVAQLKKVAPTITNSTGILNNYSALEVVLGAVGLSSDIGETALLKDLLTQDPTSSTSLVQTSANQQYLAFAEAMQGIPAVQFQLGDTANLSVATSGADATSFTLQNTAYNSNPADTSATNVGQQWQFIMNDGTAGASIGAALTAATSGKYTYTVTDGQVTSSLGAPAVTVTTDASGNSVYTLATATDSSGKPTTQVSVVSVSVPTAGSVGATSQINDVVAAMSNAGLDASLSSTGTLTVAGANLDRTGIPVYTTTAASQVVEGSSTIAMGAGAAGLSKGALILYGSTVIGQVDSVDSSGNVTLVGTSSATIPAGATLTVYNGLAVSSQAEAATTTSSKVIALGSDGTLLIPGQVLRDGNTVLGTVASVDSNGNVTLTANSKAAVAVGDIIDVAGGAVLAHAGVAATATAATAAGSTTVNLGVDSTRFAAGQTLFNAGVANFTASAQSATSTSSNVIALGSAGLKVIPGQALFDGSTVLGIAASVDSDGNVTLTSDSLSAVAQGDTISASGSVILGTVKSVSSQGVVTLTSASTTAVSVGDAILAVPPVSGVTIPALSDPENLNKIVNEYETNKFEAAQGKQNLGMQEALYYTRKIGSITSIDALMSDPTLLSVVEANLGLPSSFGELDYDQQHATLTSEVKLSDFQNADYVKTSAERYLTLVGEYNTNTSDTSGILSLFGGSSDTSGILSLFSSSSSSSNSTDSADSLITALYGNSSTPTLPATSGTPPSDTAILSLFA